MTTLKLLGFTGENPKVTPRLLGDMAAQEASNVRLDDGVLTPVRQQRFEYQLPTAPPQGYQTIYKNGGTWLGWGANVYAAPGPVAADRLYVTGDGAPKMIVAGVTYPLAVPFPATQLTVTLGGTPTPGAAGTTRLYVYTWVTAFGEESEPCPISADVFWTPGQTTTLTGFAVTPAGRNITLQRIYRAQTGKTGTQLFFIAERSASTASFADTISPELLQEVLPSANWNAPPADMNGLIALPNGMMAAYSGKELCFSEPYRPHAWPEAYRLTMDYPIVGMGAFGSSVVVTTQGTPYIVTGTAPENMVSEKIEQNLPCINARGIVDLGYSVAYPSSDGLVQVSSTGAVVISVGLFSRDDWLRMNPATMVADQYNGRYFTSYAYLDVDGLEYSGTLIFDLTGEQRFLLRSDVRATAMFYDLPTGVLYLLIGSKIYEWDATSQPNALMSWKSKLFVLPKPTNFGAILIEADTALTPEEIEAIQAEIDRITAENLVLFALDSIGGEMNGAPVNTYAINDDMMLTVPTLSRTASINIFANRKLVASTGLLNRMARLPSGFLATQWEIQVSGDMPITQITMAGTGAELAGA